jgi:hypothetical protein
VLHREILAAPLVVLSLVDNSLLALGADNVLRHFLVIPTADAIRLHACGSISFDGVIASPSAVRVLSWMIPSAQKRQLHPVPPESALILSKIIELGDPADDLAVATVLMMVGGNLVLLKPSRVCVKRLGDLTSAHLISIECRRSRSSIRYANPR